MRFAVTRGADHISVMLRLTLSLVLVLAVSAAAADQRDKRLDSLFESLGETERADQTLAVQAKIWEVWIESRDDETNRLMDLGVAAMRAHDLGLALMRFDDVVLNEPDFAEGWNKRATVNFLIGDFASSVEDIKRTLALEPRHFGALSGLGMIYDRVGEKSGALKAFRKAIEINPHLPGVRVRIERLTKELSSKRI
jgi:Flp pilus assembly protein TadD